MYKVMIVDDNMTNLIIAKKALEDDYEILPVSSGQTALEFLHEMPEPPDVVLLDVDMPEVNGFFVISQMKNVEKHARIPVIFLTLSMIFLRVLPFSVDFCPYYTTVFGICQ